MSLVRSGCVGGMLAILMSSEGVFAGGTGDDRFVRGGRSSGVRTGVRRLLVPTLGATRTEDDVRIFGWWCRGFGVMIAVATVIGMLIGLTPSRALGSVSPLTNPAKIQTLAAAAYAWGLPAEFVYRFENYNRLVTAPRNALGGGSVPAAWNNNATNAGDASVLYLNAMIDLSSQRGRGGTKELVLTVPPSKRNYYVVDLLDDFINTVGSIGTRTTPSCSPVLTPTRRPVGPGSTEHPRES